ncbi:hypothetical protein D3C72_731010 [compost metagenome]
MLRKPRLQPAERTAGSYANHNRVDPAVQLFKQLGRSRGAVRQRVGLVIELVNIEAARDLLRQPLRVVLIVGRVAFVDVGARQHHLSAQRAQMKNFLAAHFVRYHQHQRIAFLRRNQCQPQPGIARRSLNNGAARCEQPFALGFVDHRQGHAVLNRAARILVFEF